MIPQSQSTPTGGLPPELIQMLQQQQTAQPTQQPIQQPQQQPTQQESGYPMPQQEPEGLLEAHTKQTIHILMAFMMQITQSSTPLYQKVDFLSKIGATIQSLNHLLPDESIRFQMMQMEQVQAQAQAESQAKTTREDQLAQLKAQALERKAQLDETTKVQKLEQSDQTHQGKLANQSYQNQQKAIQAAQQEQKAQQEAEKHLQNMSHKEQQQQIKAQQAQNQQANTSQKKG